MKSEEVGLSDIGYFLLVTLCLYFTQLLILIIPFRLYSVLFKDKPGLVYNEITPERIFIVRKALLRGLKYLPWNGKCLVQALSGKLLLRRVGLPGTIYLGIKKNDGKLKAHAWLISGDHFVSGKEGHKEFTVVRTIK